MPDIYNHALTLEEEVIANDPNWLKPERVEFGDGIRIFLVGHSFPQKGFPTPKAIGAINLVKRLVLETLRAFGPFVLLMPKKRVLKAFRRTAEVLLSPLTLKPEYQNSVTRELIRFFDVFLRDWGNKQDVEMSSMLLAHVIEYDSAYRIRLQDLCSETTKEALINSPRKEIRRLIALNRQRDYKEVSDKLVLLGNVATYLLLIPSIRKRFREAVNQMDLKNLQMDESDVYWGLMKTDYDIRGHSFEYRKLELENVYGIK